MSQNGKTTCDDIIIGYFLYKLQISKTAVTLKNALYERNIEIYEYEVSMFVIELFKLYYISCLYRTKMPYDKEKIVKFTFVS